MHNDDKQKTSSRCWVTVGPPSTRMNQHQSNINQRLVFAGIRLCIVPLSISLTVARRPRKQKRGGHHLIFRGGGGCRGQILYFDTARRTLKISNCITCFYRTVLEVKYLFHAEPARNSLFQKHSTPPPLGDWMVLPSPKFFILKTLHPPPPWWLNGAP